MNDAPRAYTEEEVQDIFLNHLATLAHYWATVTPDEGEAMTVLDRCNGLVHSILSNISGSGLAHPAIDLRLAPHESDKAFHISEGENYFQPGMVINNCLLHQIWNKYERTKI